MIVVERGLNILGAQIAERPAQPGFRRRTDGPYTWISFLKAFILSNPRVAATFTVPRVTAQRGSSASEAIRRRSRYDDLVTMIAGLIAVLGFALLSMQ
jgi:hypothetical protein